MAEVKEFNINGTVYDVKDASARNSISNLATVASSGSYNDLSNTPTIPTVNNATLTITQGGTTKGTFTANASSDVTIALDAGGGSIGFPDYTSGVSISSGHTCLSNGFVVGHSTFNAGTGEIKVNNVRVNYWNAASSAQCPFFIDVSKDDVVTFSNASDVVFFPCKE